MSMGNKRDCSALLQAALASWAAGDVAQSQKYYTQVADALTNHKGLGDAKMWLAGACVFKELRDTMIAAGVQDLSKVLCCTWDGQLAWLVDPTTCEYVAQNDPKFLSALVQYGPPEDMLFTLEDENTQTRLEYFPASVRKAVQQAWSDYYDTDVDTWARYLSNAAQALAKCAPQYVPTTRQAALEWLSENEVSESALQAFISA